MQQFNNIAETREYIATQADKAEKLIVAIKAAGQFFDKTPAQAIELGEEALEKWVDKEKNKPEAAQAYFSLGRIYAVIGESERSEELFKEAQKLFVDLGDMQHYSEATLGLSTVAWGRGEYDKGLELAYEGLQQAKDSRYRRAEGWANVFLGSYYYDLQAYETARNHYQTALPIVKEDPEADLYTRALSGICSIEIKEKNYDRALEIAYQSLKICNEEKQSEYTRSRVLNNIGSILKYQGKYGEAFNYYQESLQIRRSRSIQASITTLTEMGELFLLQEGYQEEAQAYLEEARELAEHINAKAKLTRTYKLLSTLYEKREEYKKALELHKKSIELRSQTIGDELEMKVNTLQTQLELVQKEKEAEIERLRNFEIKRHNKAMTDSINYARRIQQAILPSIEALRQYFPQSFVFYQPRDIVSGDFYWFWHQTDYSLLVASDCTGHGVPGAFMSLIGDALLRRIVQGQGLNSPEAILSEMHLGIRRALRQNETQNRDGMDMSVCLIKHQEQELHFAGAKSPLVYVQGGVLHEISGDKLPIGGRQREQKRVFTRHTIRLDQPTQIYLLSDGFQDQFGGADNRKFMRKPLRKLLERIHALPPAEQCDQLAKTFFAWRGQNRQVDDVMVLGVKMG